MKDVFKVLGALGSINEALLDTSRVLKKLNSKIGPVSTDFDLRTQGSTTWLDAYLDVTFIGGSSLAYCFDIVITDEHASISSYVQRGTLDADAETFHHFSDKTSRSVSEFLEHIAEVRGEINEFINMAVVPAATQDGKMA